MKDYPGIIFFGTPEFAVGSLDAILNAGYHVLAVVTSPDKPAGRGLKVSSSAVKRFAVEKNIPVLQPLSLKDPLFIEQLREIAPDLQVIVAFRKLPDAVWKMPPLGTFNLHASLLPKFRGAAPINHAIMKGEKESGVTTFFLQEEIDTGNMIFSEKVSISDNETAGELHDALMKTGAGLVVRTIEAITSGNVIAVPQVVADPSSDLLKAPKIHKEDCRININGKVNDVYNQIRGLSPHPGAFIETVAADGTAMFLKIFNGIPEITDHTIASGEFISDGRNVLKLALTDGFITITKLQLAGRKPMETQEFLRGFGRHFLRTT